MIKIKKKTPEEFIQELKEDYRRWNYLYKHGGSDPSWSDGVNLNLIRNHIIIDKKRIEENLKIEEYPSDYYKETPMEVDDDYMVNPDEIRKNAKQALESWNSYFYLQDLKNAEYYLDKYQLVETGIQAAVNRIHVLEIAINEDDLVTMRRLGRYDEQQFEDMKNAFEKLSKINMEEEKQIFFAEIL